MRAEEFQGFVGGICTSIEVVDAEQMQAVLAYVDPTPAVEEGDIVLRGFTAEEFQAGGANQYLLGRDAAALATRIEWSPSDDEPTTAAWILVAVTFGQEAFFAVKRDLEQRWWRIDPPDAPWFALSTAAGLRAAITNGTPMVAKAGFNRSLFQRPKDNPRPTLDKDGRL